MGRYGYVPSLVGARFIIHISISHWLPIYQWSIGCSTADRYLNLQFFIIVLRSVIIYLNNIILKKKSTTDILGIIIVDQCFVCSALPLSLHSFSTKSLIVCWTKGLKLHSVYQLWAVAWANKSHTFWTKHLCICRLLNLIWRVQLCCGLLACI
jgi:hypothetical protein